MFTSFVRWIKAHDLLTYFVLAFLFTYAAWSVTLFAAGENDPNRMTDLPTLFQFLGMWGPALAGILVTAMTRGKAGLQELFRRVLLWRVPLRWYLLILFFWPVIVILRSSRSSPSPPSPCGVTRSICPPIPQGRRTNLRSWAKP